MSVVGDMPCLTVALPNEPAEYVALYLPVGVTHIGVRDLHEGEERVRAYRAPRLCPASFISEPPRLDPDGRWCHDLPDGTSVFVGVVAADADPRTPVPCVVVTMPVLGARGLAYSLVNPDAPDIDVEDLAASLVAAADYAADVA
jgi:hypothetical protein